MAPPEEQDDDLIVTKRRLPNIPFTPAVQHTVMVWLSE